MSPCDETFGVLGTLGEFFGGSVCPYTKAAPKNITLSKLFFIVIVFYYKRWVVFIINIALDRYRQVQLRIFS